MVHLSLRGPVDMSEKGSSTLSARVHFASCPTERVSEYCAGGPPVEKEVRSKSKRRSSGLNLLRPKSSGGKVRNSSIAQPTPVPSHSFAGPALPPDNTSPAWWPPQSAPQVLQWAAGAEDRWAEGWEILSKPSAYSLHSAASSSHEPSASSSRQSRAAAVLDWHGGRIESVKSRGGSGAGHGIIVSSDDQPVIDFAPLSPKAAGHGPSTGATPMSVSDVQLCHPSVLNRDHVLLVRMPVRPLPLPPAIPLSPPASPSSTVRRKPDRPATTPGLVGVFGFRPRGRTFSGPAHGTAYDSIDSRMEYASSSPQSSGVSPSTASVGNAILENAFLESSLDRTVFLSFDTETERQEWYAIIRSFCLQRTPDDPNCHRRLGISVFDLVETVPASSQKHKEHDGDKTTEVWSRMSRGETHATTGYADDSVISKKARSLKSGWSERDKLCLEVLNDDLVMGRTSWTKATDKGTPPFWGETLSFSDLPSFSTCSINLYRQGKGRAVIIATVDLPLVSDFAKSKDERYPVRSVTDGTVVGELRLSVAFQEVETLPVEQYKVLELVKPSSVEMIYHLDSRNQLDGLYDTLAKIGLATGDIFPLVAAMADREAQACKLAIPCNFCEQQLKPKADRTLFRGNTPLSKLFESTIRMLCHDFLVQSIGSTITRLVDTPAGTGKVLTEHGKPDSSELDRVWNLVEACWTDIYAARGSMHPAARSCLGSLFWSVKEHHPDTAETHLPFKAISSFVFLRLLNPAIMRPHLFGLRSGLLPPGPRKTATLLARVMSSMSFFTPRDAPRDPELALFADLIRFNHDMMLDYLSTFSSPPETISPSPSSLASALVRERKAMLPQVQAEAIPTMSIAGPVDLQAEAAILSATLHQRRCMSYAKSDDYSQADSGLHTMLRALDDNLRALHGVRQQDDPTPAQPMIGTPPRSRRLHGPHHSRMVAHLPLPTPPPTEQQSADGALSSTSLVFREPPPSTYDEHEKAQTSHREVAGAFIRRSLSGKGMRRRGSLPGMRIRPAGREADDPGAPRTARR